jgi:hypothetical protein
MLTSNLGRNQSECGQFSPQKIWPKKKRLMFPCSIFIILMVMRAIKKKARFYFPRNN